VASTRCAISYQVSGISHQAWVASLADSRKPTAHRDDV